MWYAIQERKIKEFYAERRAETTDPDEIQALRDAEEDDLARDRKSTRLNSSHIPLSRMPSSA